MVPEIEKFDEESHERQLRKVQSSKRSNKLLTCESVDQCFKNSSGVSARQKSTLETESDNPAKYNIDYLLMQHAKQVSKKTFINPSVIFQHCSTSELKFYYVRWQWITIEFTFVSISTPLVKPFCHHWSVPNTSCGFMLDVANILMKLLFLVSAWEIQYI